MKQLSGPRPSGENAAARVDHEGDLTVSFETTFEQGKVALSAGLGFEPCEPGPYVRGDQVEQVPVALGEVAIGTLQGGAGLRLRRAADNRGDLPGEAESAVVAVVVELTAAPLPVAEKVGDHHRPRCDAAKMLDHNRLLAPETGEGLASLRVEEARWVVAADQNRRAATAGCGPAHFADDDRPAAHQPRQQPHLSVHLLRGTTGSEIAGEAKGPAQVRRSQPGGYLRHRSEDD